MRLIVAVAPAFGAGILLESWARGSAWAWAGAAAATAVLLALAARRAPPHPLFAFLVAAVVALAVGAAASARTRARVTAGPAWPAWPPASAAPLVLEGIVRVAPEAAPGGHGGWRALVDVDTLDAATTRTPADARLLVRGDGAPPAAWPGERVRLRATVRAPRGYQNPGAFDRARFLGGRGVDGLAAVAPPGLVRVAGAASPWREPARALARARAAWAERLSAAAPGDGGALLAALVVGARAGVRPSVEADFRDAGVTHVLSVSGLHLAAVAFLVFALVRRAWLRVSRWAERIPADRVAALAAAPLAIAYAQLTGAEVATQRALVATLVVLGATALGRRPDGATALAVAFLVVLADAPWALHEASFQLSFAAAAALCFVAPRWTPPPDPRPSRARRVFVGAWRLGAATLAASLATAPLTALHFGVVQPAGLVANFVVVPFAELVVLPLGLAGALLAALWAPLGAPLLWAAGQLAALLAWVVHHLASVSPVIAAPAPGALALVACGAALVALARLRGRRGLVAAAAALAVAAALTWHDTVRVPAARRDLVITFLDVGQGDAAVVELPGGETWLVDAGGRLFGAPGPGADRDARLAALAGDPGEQAVARFLAARHVRRLALVIVSHPHVDHYGGLGAVAARMPIDELWITGDEIDDPAWHDLVAQLAARGTRIVRPPLGVARVTRGVRAVVLAPSEPAAAADEAAAPAVAPADAPLVTPSHPGENDDSLVVALEFAGRRVLFTGDLEAEGEAALVATYGATALAADVVKAPHHGSRTSSTAALVAATRPRAVVISCGPQNRFGFPATSVVARWRAAGAAVHRTDRAGAITVRIGPRGDLRLDGFVRDPLEVP